MNQIKISDLEVCYRVGVTDAERAQPQRLLLSLVMDFDFHAAAATDRIEDTIDYFRVAQDLLKYGEGRSWCLLEKLATELADRVLSQWRSSAVSLEVKKFPIPQAQYVSVLVRRVLNPDSPKCKSAVGGS